MPQTAHSHAKIAHFHTVVKENGKSGWEKLKGMVLGMGMEMGVRSVLALCKLARFELLIVALNRRKRSEPKTEILPPHNRRSQLSKCKGAGEWGGCVGGKCGKTSRGVAHSYQLFVQHKNILLIAARKREVIRKKKKHKKQKTKKRQENSECEMPIGTMRGGFGSTMG